ncbi:ribosome biogenesis GTP-binding protein YihA/YsxC [Desulfococcus sp.]|uniref:ribosome biogenesis GTP-binding protein YihA/YsxC n=1 Tax=Desulfococcus sp. TaxID=2025834 RepID=UPI0035947044
MIITSAEFVISAVKPSQYPPGLLPEIAFAGRSNVGKSSLINTLVNRKRLVKTSSTPGRTQLINFFEVNGQFSFVDLPGYGYAKVPLPIKKTWGPMIETYLSGRETLAGVVLILDIRRVPRQEEFDFIAWLKRFGIERILVLTKTDKLSTTRQRNQRGAIAAALGVDADRLILFSAQTRKGREQVWEAVADVVRRKMEG